VSSVLFSAGDFVCANVTACCESNSEKVCGEGNREEIKRNTAVFPRIAFSRRKSGCWRII